MSAANTKSILSLLPGWSQWAQRWVVAMLWIVGLGLGQNVHASCGNWLDGRFHPQPHPVWGVSDQAFGPSDILRKPAATPQRPCNGPSCQSPTGPLQDLTVTPNSVTSTRSFPVAHTGTMAVAWSSEFRGKVSESRFETLDGFRMILVPPPRASF
ncbi:MAG: hypothetical protein U0905_12980 [Pirellulales bacterium]